MFYRAKSGVTPKVDKSQIVKQICLPLRGLEVEKYFWPTEEKLLTEKSFVTLMPSIIRSGDFDKQIYSDNLNAFRQLRNKRKAFVRSWEKLWSQSAFKVFVTPEDNMEFKFDSITL